jgi:hypothetical protein
MLEGKKTNKWQNGYAHTYVWDGQGGKVFSIENEQRPGYQLHYYL